MKKTFLVFLLLLFSASYAHAYKVEFDWQGTGNDANLATFDEWDFVDVGEWNADANGFLGEYGDVFTYQESATGLFEESFTIKITEGSDSDAGAPGDVTFGSGLYADVTLTGQYVSDSAIYFTGGGGVIYDDVNATLNYDAGDDDIAGFVFSNALISELTGTLLGETLGMKLDFTFTFNSADPDYWGDDEENLIGKQWLLGFVGTRIEIDDVEFGDYYDDNDILIEWDLANGQIEFGAVPEPGTIMLFGIGLLGIARFGRKKLFK